MTIELNTLAPKKWTANYGGNKPTIDSSNGVFIGDLALDSSITPYRVWKCLDNTAGTPVWVCNNVIINSISNTYSVTTSDNIIISNAFSTAFTVTLPASASNTGLHLYIKKIDSSDNAVTVDGNGSEKIDGELTQTISGQSCMEIICDGTGWYII